MIADDSPLRRLPANLDPKQTLFLDGIRHAAELASFAYDRLARALTALATNLGEGAQRGSFTEPFLDAWAVVDAIDRLRGLRALAPGLEAKPHPDGRASFLDQTEITRKVRNVSDHLPQRIDYVLAKDGAALGKLSWITVLNPQRFLSCTIIPGTIRTGVTPIINPLGKTVTPPTDHIVLMAGEYSVNLSEQIAIVREWVADLEKGLDEWLTDSALRDSRAGTDIMTAVVFVHRPPTDE